MKEQRTKRYHSDIAKQKKTKKRDNKMVRNIVITVILFLALGLLLTAGEWKEVVNTALLQVIGAIVFILLLLFFVVSKMGTGKKSPKTRRDKSLSQQKDVDPAPPIKKNIWGAKTGTRHIRRMDPKNFNWSDEDIVRYPKMWEDETENKEQEFVPYRSPFDPINPPKEPDTEKDTDDEIVPSVEPTQAVEEDTYEESRHSGVWGVSSGEQPGPDTYGEDGIGLEYEEPDFYDDGGTVPDHYELTEEDEGEERCGGVIGLSDFAGVLQQNGQENDPIQKPQKRKIRAVSAKKKEVPIYDYPPMQLLKKNDLGQDTNHISSLVQQNAVKLVQTLESFKIEAKVIHISQGPSVTRYELQPKVGVKVSKIVNLADDIALNLAAKDVRIEAPIPGKAAIGIEVPNKEVVPVFLSEVIASKEFQQHSSKLIFALGKDIAGKNIVADIARMPHLLIAGATGSGKSVCINTLITSILYKASPEEVRLLMIDPKVVELNIYNGIPHLLVPVVTDPKKASGALQWAVQEMSRRYQLFADNNVRDLKGYNVLLKQKGEQENKLPQIVIIIDELADLMMAAPNEVEDAICRLAQMARAAGMHLVIATQRPSVDVITGVIKANIPSRISFAVSSQVDSRTILDAGGAEKLLGKGDMLFSPMGQPKPLRVQGAFISDKEVEAMVSHIKSNIEVKYDESILANIHDQTDSYQAEPDEEDELLPQAVGLALERGQASASLMQRRFRIGYARAARILDQMEALGVVSGSEGSKPRSVLISKEEWEEMNF